MKPKIIFSSGSNGVEISFPSHKGRYGTCDFMTKTCAVECRLSVKNVEKQAYQFFLENSVDVIVKEMILQAKIFKPTMFSWFVESGDCPLKMTVKITDIMQRLAVLGWHQNGFTRNKALWRNSHKIKNLRLCLTIEDRSMAEELSKYGLVAIPDYASWEVEIMVNNTIFNCGGGMVGVCGQGVVEFDDLESEEDCSICFSKNFGCYA